MSAVEWEQTQDPIVFLKQIVTVANISRTTGARIHMHAMLFHLNYVLLEDTEPEIIMEINYKFCSLYCF